MTADAPRVLAIDPGRDKCGLAVVMRPAEILSRSIVPTGALIDTVRALVETYRPISVICGGGTGSKPILRDLRQAGLNVPISVVDESYTSELARRRYVAENPARGLARLLPRSLRAPSEPYDDYVAVILAERYWSSEACPPPAA